MTQKQHLTFKWLVIALLLIIAVTIMYYKHRPIKEVPQKANNFPKYNMYQ